MCKEKRKYKIWMINLMIIVFLFLGILFFFIEPLKNWIVSFGTDSLRINTTNLNEIEKNNIQGVSFQFEKVRELDLKTILMATANRNDITIIGRISIPSVSLNLPIGLGVSNDTLALTAGTMKKNQEMGQGNYALAGHHMKREDLLFSPLFRVGIGDNVYLTDLKYVYEYQIDEQKMIEATDVKVIEDTKGEKILTLITCDKDGTERLLTRGFFLRKIPIEKATHEMREAFS